MKKINIGILGFGSMGKVHAFCIENMRYFYSPLGFEAEVAGICTAHPQKTESICAEYGFPVSAVCEDDLINDPDIDVIDICTPNIYHYETIKKALAAGKHIYCEKPLCTTRAQADEIAKLASLSERVCTVVFNNRYLPAMIRARELVNEGRIGRVLSFSAEYLHNSCADPEKNAGWKQNANICGGGVLFDLGSHCIDLVYSLCGEFESVSGMSQIAFPTRRGADGKVWQTNADEAFYMLCRMKCGARGTITVSKLINGTNDDLNIAVYGERGSLRFSLMQPNYLRFYDAAESNANLGGLAGYRDIECVGRYAAPGGIFPSPKAPIGWLRGHMQSMYSFLDAVSTGRKNTPDFSDAAHIQAVMEAAYASASDGSRDTRI
ncbi:MAG: Gfo/Idh/MocA family protein [Eubacteriales bacterium]